MSKYTPEEEKANKDVFNIMSSIQMEKATFARKIENSLFFQDNSSTKDKKDRVIYRLNLLDKKITEWSPEALDKIYKEWRQKPKKDADGNEGEDHRLQILGAIFHKTPFEIDKNFNVIKTLSKKNLEGLVRVNRYVGAKWMYSYDPEKEYVLPEIYQDFFQHLVGDYDVLPESTKEERETSFTYLLEWLAWSLDPSIKQLPFLCLIDAGQGIGKGTLGQICRELHGYHNSREMTDRFLKSNFNAGLEGNTLVIINEMSLKGAEQTNKLKAMSDAVLEIEAKGQDTREVANYIKLIIFSNELAIELQKADRRYSVISTALLPLKDNTKLLAKYGGMKEFQRKLVAPTNIAELGGFLKMFRGVIDDNEIDHLDPLKITKFKDIEYGSLAEWKQFVLSELPMLIAQDKGPTAIKSTKQDERNHIDIPYQEMRRYIREYVPFFKNESFEAKRSIPSFLNMKKLFKEHSETHRLMKTKGIEIFRIYVKKFMFENAHKETKTIDVPSDLI